MALAVVGQRHCLGKRGVFVWAGCNSASPVSASPCVGAQSVHTACRGQLAQQLGRALEPANAAGLIITAPVSIVGIVAWLDGHFSARGHHQPLLVGLSCLPLFGGFRWFRRLVSISLSLSVSVCLSLPLFPPLSLCLYVSLSLSLSLCLCVAVCLSVSVCLSVCLCLCLCLSLSLSLSVTALTKCLFVLAYICVYCIVVFICVCSIARIGCWIGSNGPYATILE